MLDSVTDTKGRRTSYSYLLAHAGLTCYSSTHRAEYPIHMRYIAMIFGGDIASSLEKVYNLFRYSGELRDDTTELQYLRANGMIPQTVGLLMRIRMKGILRIR
ncbi:hypothetical protein [Paenibacillus sp. 1-18]|uniref:hypothetical protein n=1 Tax=Paenibacillus sp. 1-18 TaxID=1333846 RepID=UPI0018CC433C|nr:hypothetical protein [Paenibacillus sp. 1-18]